MNILLRASLPALAAASFFWIPQQQANAETWDEWLGGEHFFGDFGGYRTRLEEKGVTFFGSYEANIAGNVSGGFSKSTAYADNFDFGLKFDLEKLFGWNGATFTASGVDRNGRSLSQDHVGNFYTIQQVFGGGTIFLYGLNLEQKFWDDKASIKAGRFAMNEVFASTPIYWLYMNNAFDGSPKSLFFTNSFSAYPGSVWGARLDASPTPESRVLLGVFQASARTYDPDLHGVDFSIRNDDGVTLIGQFQWKPEFFKRPVPSANAGKSIVDGENPPVQEMRGLPGNYWLGIYYTFWDFAKFGSAERADETYGIYLHGDQMVYQEAPGSDQGLTLWLSGVFQPQEEIQTFPYQVSGGVIYKGLLPGRDNDSVVLGAVYGSISDDYAKTVSAAGGGYPSYEVAFEAGYRVQLTKFAYVMPDFQYIANPGGTGRIADAAVLGVRLGVTF